VVRGIRDPSGASEKKTSSFFAENRRENRAGSGRNGAAGAQASPFSGGGVGEAEKRGTAWILAEMRVGGGEGRTPPMEGGERFEDG
jgi:hypothetical protein